MRRNDKLIAILVMVVIAWMIFRPKNAPKNGGDTEIIRPERYTAAGLDDAERLGELETFRPVIAAERIDAVPLNSSFRRQ